MINELNKEQNILNIKECHSQINHTRQKDSFTGKMSHEVIYKEKANKSKKSKIILKL